jgi:predicted 3-demethylubiquinone-9 3-methyltransferase (glyoxalase superfamily)
MTSVTKIRPFLWFDGNMQEAVTFYASVFKTASVRSINPMSATFELEGQSFMALNGGPMFKFNEAVSFFVSCTDQAEVDYYWSALLQGGGTESQCGWLKDRFGLSWQIIPDALGRYMSDPDQAKAGRVVQAMLKMRKIIIADLDAAANGG